MLRRVALVDVAPPAGAPRPARGIEAPRRAERVGGRGRAVARGDPEDLGDGAAGDPRRRTEDRARQQRPVGGEGERLAHGRVTQHRMRPPGTVRHAEGEEAEDRRRIGHEPERRVPGHPAHAVGGADLLEQVGLVREDQVEGRVGVRREAPHHAADGGNRSARGVGREGQRLAMRPAGEPVRSGADEARAGGVRRPARAGNRSPDVLRENADMPRRVVQLLG